MTPFDADIQPRLTALPDGSVLAVNPHGTPRIGVVGVDDKAARVAFADAVARRSVLLQTWEENARVQVNLCDVCPFRISAHPEEA